MVITINAPSSGWRVGGNYINGEWADSSGNIIQDYSSIYINGLSSYNGWFDNSDSNGNWRYSFGGNDNVTLKLTVRNSSYSNIGVNITSIQYALYSNGCYSEWCASFSTATWSFVSGGSGEQLTSGSGIIKLHKPSSGWEKGYYTVKATISGSAGTSSISGSNLFQVKDLTAANVTINSPTINQTITGRNFSFSATTTENAVCSISSIDYNAFYNWHGCAGASSNASNSSSTSLVSACNYTYYGFNNSTQYQTEYVYKDTYSFYNNSYSEWSYSSALSTGGTSHTYTMNVTKWRNQSYGIKVSCYDEDNNQGEAYTAINVQKS